MVARTANRQPTPASKPKRFTITTIAALAPRPGVQYVEWDTEPTGFGVRVSPAGTKTFIFKYRTKAGRVRWATVGRVGDVPLDDARDRAFKMRGQVADGKDPLREIDSSGKMLWELKVPNVCGFDRLDDGRFLCSGAGRVVIVTRSGQIAWQTSSQGFVRRVHRR